MVYLPLSLHNLDCFPFADCKYNTVSLYTFCKTTNFFSILVTLKIFLPFCVFNIQYSRVFDDSSDNTWLPNLSHVPHVALYSLASKFIACSSRCSIFSSFQIYCMFLTLHYILQLPNLLHVPHVALYSPASKFTACSSRCSIFSSFQIYCMFLTLHYILQLPNLPHVPHVALYSPASKFTACSSRCSIFSSFQIYRMFLTLLYIL
jgi:hypothetical protein